MSYISCFCVCQTLLISRLKFDFWIPDFQCFSKVTVPETRIFKGQISYTLLLMEHFMTSHSSTQHMHEIFLQSEGGIEPWPHKYFLILFCKMGLLGAKYIALSLFKVKISISVREMELLNLCDRCLHHYILVFIKLSSKFWLNLSVYWWRLFCENVVNLSHISTKQKKTTPLGKCFFSSETFADSYD